LREINELIYNTIRSDPTYRTICGATVTDPRISIHKTPIGLVVSDAKPAYGVYYRNGSAKPLDFIDGVQENNQVYTVEVYGKKLENADDAGEAIVALFNDKNFETTTYLVKYTSASLGSLTFDDARKLYFTTVTIYLDFIYHK